MIFLTTLSRKHRRRIKIKEKAKVVIAVWGAELIQFIAALAILHQDDLKKGMNSHPILHIVLVLIYLFTGTMLCFQKLELSALTVLFQYF